MLCAHISHITFGFPDKEILHDFSFRLTSRSRIGFIGANGSGKTTLFRLLIGDLTPDSGEVIRSRGTKIGYMKQRVTIDKEQSIRSFLELPFADLIRMEMELADLHEAMSGPEGEKYFAKYDQVSEQFRRSGGYEFQNRIQEMLHGLGFGSLDVNRSLNSLSGGEQSRIQLARLLLENPDLLLLDEPTNHLDIKTTEWLEKYLESFPGGVVVVSHDRYFLDRVTKEIWELDQRRITTFKGNYSAYLAEKQHQDEIRLKQYKLQRKKIDKLETFIRKNISGQKTKMAQSRMKTLERIERVEKPTSSRKSVKFNFEMHRSSGRIVFDAENISKRVAGKQLFQNVHLKLEKGETVGIIGPNGSGKSTFLKILMNAIPPDTGTITMGYHVQPAYFDQHLAELNENKRIIDEIWDKKPHWTEFEVRSYMGRFLFSGDKVFSPIAPLSGGEKARIALAGLLLKKANLLLLDEPTNHLDMSARQTLETALKSYPGTVLIVTHDRYLLDTVAQRIWSLEDGTINDYPGNYSYYREKRRESESVGQGAETERKASGESGKPSRRDMRKVRAEIRKKTGKSSRHYEKCIAELEGQLDEIKASLNSPALAMDWKALDELTAREKSLQDELLSAMEKWETALEEEAKMEEYFA